MPFSVLIEFRAPAVSRRSERQSRVSDLRRHRFPRGGLSHDAEGLSLDLRPLSQCSLSGQNLPGESAHAGFNSYLPPISFPALPVPFGEIQRQIVTAVARLLRVVLYRRMMLRIAEALARTTKAKALVTGESLAQVASQTLDNMAVIQQASTLPILRPLVGMDKQEIVDQARRIGTFDISSIPDQDCCQLFVPKHPATTPWTPSKPRTSQRCLSAEMMRCGSTVIGILLGRLGDERTGQWEPMTNRKRNAGLFAGSVEKNSSIGLS